MSKYEPLQLYLERIPPVTEDVILLFQDIERIVGFQLPSGSKAHRAWWANRTTERHHPHAQAWLAAGWEVDKVDFSQSWVRFRRQ